MDLAAIETEFDGHQFRSRAEARWAVFFKTTGIRYEYEKQGFDLDGVRYLPDFYLPDQLSWVEIKGNLPTAEEDQVLRRFSLAVLEPVYCFPGNISLPKQDDSELPRMVYWWEFAKGIMYDAGEVIRDAHPESSAFQTSFHVWSRCPFCQEFDMCAWGNSLYSRCGCIAVSRIKHPLDRNIFHYFDAFNHPQLLEGYQAARKARFEYGESGTVPELSVSHHVAQKQKVLDDFPF